MDCNYGAALKAISVNIRASTFNVPGEGRRLCRPMLTENAREHLGTHYSAANLILVIARSAAIPRFAGQSPGSQVLNFRRLRRFARNDTHSDALAKTIRFALVSTIVRWILILTPMAPRAAADVTSLCP
jgi:hypothetical protein